jgi:hypothetical protein
VFHLKDVTDLAGNLSSVLEASMRAQDKIEKGYRLKAGEAESILSDNDERIARAEFKELWDALETPDTAGAVTADLEKQPVVKQQVKNTIENIKNRSSVADVTGGTFQTNAKGYPERVPGATRQRGTTASKPDDPEAPEGAGTALSILDYLAGVYFISRYGPDEYACMMEIVPLMCSHASVGGPA